MLNSLLMLTVLSLPGAPSSIHSEDAELHAKERNKLPPARSALLLRTQKQIAQPETVFRKTVYGYLPYWRSVDDVPWGHLSHLSFFSQEIGADGELGLDHQWDTNGASLVEVAHSHGVKLTLTVTLFDAAAIETLLTSEAARTAAIQNILSSVLAQGADGVNIDFEIVPQTVRNQFVEFVGDLTVAFHDVIPDSHVSIATPAVDWRSAYDYKNLARVCDGLNIMAYDYHWRGGEPGPVAPVQSGTLWGSLNVSQTIEDYLALVDFGDSGKLVLGVPLYGRDWPTSNTELPGVSTGNGASMLVSPGCDSGSFLEESVWDENSLTPYRVYEEGGQTHQQFCENEASLNTKLDLVDAHNLGGVMFWAIGYAQLDHPLWEAVNDRFEVLPTNAAPVAIARVASGTVTEGTEVVLDGSESFDPDGDALTYAWRAIQGPAVEIKTSTQSLATASPPAGDYLFELAVSDGQLETKATLALVVEADSSSEKADAGLEETDSGVDGGVKLDAGASQDGGTEISPNVSSSSCANTQCRGSELGIFLLGLVAAGLRRRNSAKRG